MRVLSAETKASTASFGSNASSIEGLTAKNENLSKMVRQQEGIVNSLSEAVEYASKNYEKGSAATDGYRIKLANAEATLSKMKNEITANGVAIG